MALLRTGDTVRLNLNARIFNAEVDPAEWKTLTQCLDTPNGSISNPMAGEIYRNNVVQVADGGCLELAIAYGRVGKGVSRDNH